MQQQIFAYCRKLPVDPFPMERGGEIRSRLDLSAASARSPCASLLSACQSFNFAITEDSTVTSPASTFTASTRTALCTLPLKA